MASKYTGKGPRYCSAYRNAQGPLFMHPIFQIPLCETCNENYHSGEFVIEDKNEIYCRWCGQGEEENLFFCDSCLKSFCNRCARTNFGVGEIERIKNLFDRWCCFLCSPQSFRDFCTKRGWKGITKEVSDSMAHRTRQQGIVNYDINRRREKFEIPAINTEVPHTIMLDGYWWIVLLVFLNAIIVVGKRLIPQATEWEKCLGADAASRTARVGHDTVEF